MNRKEFIDLIISTKEINKDIIETSKNIDDFHLAYSILMAIEGSDFINTLLNPKNYGAIDLAAGDLKFHCVFNNATIKEQGIKFIDDLAARSKDEIKNNYFNNSFDPVTAPKRNIILGIDLGTTNTVAAFVEKDVSSTVVLKNGSRILPSVVSINKNKKIDVGENAQRQLIANPEETFFSIKRFIGRRTADFNPLFFEKYPFNLNLNDEKILLESKKLEKNLQCEEISAQILIKIKSEAEDYLNATINECVITVPAYFDNNQRTATKTAAKIAGMEVKRIINEPTAAAFAYEIQKKGDQSNTLVLDLGGGTFDISLIRSLGNELDNFSVIASLGDRDLGGDDYTNVIFKLINDQLKKENNNIVINASTKNLIREEAIKAKHILSYESEVELNLSFLPTKNNEPFNFSYLLTKSEFESKSKKITKKLESIITKFLNLEKVKRQKINKVVAVGGASRMSIFKELVEKLCHMKPQIDINPDEVVAHGAAYCAEYLFNSENPRLVIDVNPLSLGTDIYEKYTSNKECFAEIIPANTPLPTRKMESFTTVYDYQTMVSVKVLQGGLKWVDENIKLGECVLENIENALAGQPICEVTFELDEEGLLKVYAIDKKTNSKKFFEISNTLNLTETQIAKMRIHANQMTNF